MSWLIKIVCSLNSINDISFLKVSSSVIVYVPSFAPPSWLGIDINETNWCFKSSESLILTLLIFVITSPGFNPFKANNFSKCILVINIPLYGGVNNFSSLFLLSVNEKPNISFSPWSNILS